MEPEIRITYDSIELKEKIQCAIGICNKQIDEFLSAHLQACRSKQRTSCRVARSRNDSQSSQGITSSTPATHDSCKAEEDDDVIECGAIFKAERMLPVAPYVDSEDDEDVEIVAVIAKSKRAV